VTREPDVPAGEFSTWLRRTRSAHLNDTAVDVPCGDCAACCTSSYFIHIRPDETGTLGQIPDELLVAAPGLPKGHVVIGYDEHGRCPMLRDGRCSIYEHRPLTCRTYDCRVFAAAGIDADRPAITERARGWAFDHATEDDRRERSAVRAAATFLQGREECFAGGAQADNPAHVAVLAVKVYDVFLEGGDEPGTVGRAASDDGRVKAVMEAYESFEARRGAPGERTP
jgi:Fe-S-cluster containining protein